MVIAVVVLEYLDDQLYVFGKVKQLFLGKLRVSGHWAKQGKGRVTMRKKMGMMKKQLFIIVYFKLILFKINSHRLLHFIKLDFKPANQFLWRHGIPYRFHGIVPVP